MKSFIRVIYFLVFITMISGCTKNDNVIKKESTGDSFKLYVSSQDIPTFTDEDIEYYDWQNQTIVFKKEYLEKRNISVPQGEEYRSECFRDGGSRMLNASSKGNFSVYIGDEFIYGGSFFPPGISSTYPRGIVIRDIENGISIGNNSPRTYRVYDVKDFSILYNENTSKQLYNRMFEIPLKDKRYDEKIFEVLEKKGLLKK